MNINAGFKTNNILGKYVKNNKNKDHKNENSGVYKVASSNWGIVWSEWKNYTQ